MHRQTVWKTVLENCSPRSLPSVRRGPFLKTYKFNALKRTGGVGFKEIERCNIGMEVWRNVVNATQGREVVEDFKKPLRHNPSNVRKRRVFHRRRSERSTLLGHIFGTNVRILLIFEPESWGTFWDDCLRAIIGAVVWKKRGAGQTDNCFVDSSSLLRNLSFSCYKFSTEHMSFVTSYGSKYKIIFNFLVGTIELKNVRSGLDVFANKSFYFMRFTFPFY